MSRAFILWACAVFGAGCAFLPACKSNDCKYQTPVDLDCWHAVGVPTYPEGSAHLPAGIVVADGGCSTTADAGTCAVCAETSCCAEATTCPQDADAGCAALDGCIQQSCATECAGDGGAP